MRLLDHDEPIDPEVAEALDAIDATLAGEAVDARYADLAEVALLLTSVRPEVPPAFAQSMDERVERRFAPAPAAAPATAASRRRRSRIWEAMGALAAVAAAVVAIVVVVANGHSGSSASSSSVSFNGNAAVPSAASGTATSAGSTSAGAGASGAPQSRHAASSAASTAAKRAAVSAPAAPNTLGTSTAALAPSTSGAPALQPPTSGRKVVQGAQLQLAAASNRIDAVAQEVYDVMSQVNGIVENSSVTQGGPGGYANFQLSVPSASLGDAMSRLSSLQYAQVVSRTDSSQDITNQYNAAGRALADARALRTSLLKQLANATTTEQIDSLRAQIRDAEASISSDQATLGRLNRQVDFSQLTVTVNASPTPVPLPRHGSGGFGLGRAAHDAGRVLTVAAGVALIAVAALTPVGLLAALAWWVGAAVRRRRREQALDSA